MNIHYIYKEGSKGAQLIDNGSSKSTAEEVKEKSKSNSDQKSIQFQNSISPGEAIEMAPNLLT